MKVTIFLIFAALVATARAAPVKSDVMVVESIPLDNGIDEYKFGYQLSDGQARREYGQLKNFGTKDEALFVEGSFSYVDPIAKQLYFTVYTADENGYHPETSHIPI